MVQVKRNLTVTECIREQPGGLYEKISDTEEYRDKVNKECNMLIGQIKDDILINQIIHNAIMEVCSLEKSESIFSIFDVTASRRHKVVYKLAKQLKEARAKNANQCRTIHELNDAITGMRSIVIKYRASNPEE